MRQLAEGPNLRRTWYTLGMSNGTSGHIRALIVFNPTAGQAQVLQQDLHAAADVWREAGWSVELCPTRGPGDGSRIARDAAAAGYHLVVAAGGDGTVNEVINGLAGTATAMAALPIGTVNVWVRELGFPLQPRAAAEALLKSRVARIDLGRAGDRYFLLMAGIGFDAAVTARVRSDEKRRLGVLAYVKEVLALAGAWRGSRVTVTLDGATTRGRVLLIVLGNSQLYGGFVRFTARASLNDGLLDVCVIRGKSLHTAPLRLLSIFLRRIDLDSEVEYHRARRVRIDSQRPLPVQVDGDHIGDTPMSFECVPGALLALLPPTLPTDDLLVDVPTERRSFRQGVLGWLGRRRAAVANGGRAPRAPAELHDRADAAPVHVRSPAHFNEEE